MAQESFGRSKVTGLGQYLRKLTYRQIKEQNTQQRTGCTPAPRWSAPWSRPNHRTTPRGTPERASDHTRRRLPLSTLSPQIPPREDSGGRLRFPSAGQRPFLPFFPLAMAHSEREEAGKKKKANEREQVGRAARTSGLFKEAGRRPFTSYPLTEQSQEFNSDSNRLEMCQASGAASRNTTPDGIKVNRSGRVLHLSVVSSYYFRTTRWTSFTEQTIVGHTHWVYRPDSTGFSEEVRPTTYTQ
jgi:hypothetical protein